jgi:hypothetical protein
MFTATLALLVLIMSPNFSFSGESACSCLSRVPSDASVSRKVKYERSKSKVVFSGQVLEISERSINGSQENVVTFRVIESWKRVRTNTVKVVTPRPTPASCGYEFRVGASYLVYVQYEEDKDFWTGICSRTMELAKAAEDLRILGKGKMF